MDQNPNPTPNQPVDPNQPIDPNPTIDLNQPAEPNQPNPNQAPFGGQNPNQPNPNQAPFGGQNPNQPYPNQAPYGGQNPNQPYPNQNPYGGQNPNQPYPNQNPYGGQNPNTPPYQGPNPGPNRANPNLNGFYDLPPVKAAISMINNIFKFEGRTSRSDYWWAVLAVFCVSFVLGILLNGVEHIFRVRAIIVLFNLLESLVSLALSVSTLALAVRRLHDTNKSGWLMLLALTGIGCIPLIIFFAQPGDPQPNQYGTVPQSVT